MVTLLPMTEPTISNTSTVPSAPVALPEPFTLTVQETGVVVGFMCRDCTMTHPIAKQVGPDYGDACAQARLNAIRCCNRVCECGTPVEAQCYLYCEACRNKHEVEREHIRYKHAKKISPLEYNGWVFVEGYGNNDGYFASLEVLRDHCRIHRKQLPAYVWTCLPLEFEIDADSIIDSALDEHYEDASDNITSVARGALQYMLDAWTEKQGIKTYTVDDDVAVVIPEQWIVESQTWQKAAAQEDATKSLTETTTTPEEHPLDSEGWYR